MKELVRVMLVAAVLLPFAGLAEERSEKSAQTAAAEKPKPKPRKKPEYKSWAEAKKVAEAWNQPVVVFVEMGGDRTSSMIKNAIFNNQAFFKDLYAENFVFCHLSVPQEKSKNRNARGPQKKSGKPDFKRLDPADKTALGMVLNGSSMPIVALMNPNGQVIEQSMTSMGDGKPLKGFVDALAEGMKRAKLGEFKLGPKVKKALAAEEKNAAFAEKMAEAALKNAK